MVSGGLQDSRLYLLQLLQPCSAVCIQYSCKLNETVVSAGYGLSLGVGGYCRSRASCCLATARLARLKPPNGFQAPLLLRSLLLLRLRHLLSSDNLPRRTQGQRCPSRWTKTPFMRLSFLCWTPADPSHAELFRQCAHTSAYFDVTNLDAPFQVWMNPACNCR